MVMFKLFRLSVAASVAFISSLSLLPSPGHAQNYPICYMINSLNQLIDLNDFCQSQSQSPKKAKACQGPFDSDGFPIAFFNELELLKAAVAEAKKRNVYASDDPKVQSALTSLLEQMPLSEGSRKLQRERRLLFKQLRETVDSKEAEKLQEKIAANTKELGNDLCLAQLMHSLNKKFQEPLFL